MVVKRVTAVVIVVVKGLMALITDSSGVVEV